MALLRVSQVRAPVSLLEALGEDLFLGSFRLLADTLLAGSPSQILEALIVLGSWTPSRPAMGAYILSNLSDLPFCPSSLSLLLLGAEVIVCVPPGDPGYSPYLSR